ncbi:MAG: hypothetical protein Q8O67_13045 [Deltaproteobacteria bacterium]|nr:hypothetical protein [Deltaproteobacteria bacterium]
MGNEHFQPTWWNQVQHGTAWQRVRDAMHRDWEQTRRDFGGAAADLDQNAGDTIQQAMGAVPLPWPTEKTPHVVEAEMRPPVERYHDVESLLAYGYAARSYYASQYPRWDDDLESELRHE